MRQAGLAGASHRPGGSTTTRGLTRTPGQRRIGSIATSPRQSRTSSDRCIRHYPCADDDRVPLPGRRALDAWSNSAGCCGERHGLPARVTGHWIVRRGRRVRRQKPAMTVGRTGEQRNRLPQRRIDAVIMAGFVRQAQPGRWSFTWQPVHRNHDHGRNRPGRDNAPRRGCGGERTLLDAERPG